MHWNWIKALIVVLLLLSGIVAMRWDWQWDAGPETDTRPEALPTGVEAASESTSGMDKWRRTHEELITERDPRIGFRLEFADPGRTSYHMGEVIDLRMVFSCTEDDAYLIGFAKYDYGRRDDSDKYHVDRAGDAVDPMREPSEMYEFFFGGIRPTSTLRSGVKHHLGKNLNQYIRFDRHGRFRIYVTTNRFFQSEGSADGKAGWHAQVASDVLEIEILARNRQWEASELTRIKKAIDSSSNRDEAIDPLQKLRFLGTEASTKELVMRSAAATSDYWTYRQGLFGTRHRQLALEEMKAVIVDPDWPIYEGFLNDYAGLDAILRGVPKHQARSAAIELLEGILITKSAPARAICETTLAQMKK